MKIKNKIWIYGPSLLGLIMLLWMHSCKEDTAKPVVFTKQKSMETMFSAFQSVGNNYNFKLENNPVIFCNSDFEFAGYCTQEASQQTRTNSVEGMTVMLFYLKTNDLPANFYKLTLGKAGVWEVYGGENFGELLNVIKTDFKFTNSLPIALDYSLKYRLDTITGKAIIDFGTDNVAAQNRGTFAVSGKSTAKIYFPDQVKTVGDEINNQIQFYENKLNEGLPNYSTSQNKEAFVYVYRGKISFYQMAQNDLENLDYKSLIKGKEYTILTGYIDKENDSSHHFVTSLEITDQSQWCTIRNRSQKKAIITEQSIRVIPSPASNLKMTISYEHDSWTDGAGHTSSYTYSNFHFDGVHIDKFKSDCWWEHD
jgi:hypothetical protein